MDICYENSKIEIPFPKKVHNQKLFYSLPAIAHAIYYFTAFHTKIVKNGRTENSFSEK